MLAGEIVFHEVLGAACGDILGSMVEGCSADEIRKLYGEIRDFAEGGRGFGCYPGCTIPGFLLWWG